MIKMKSFIEVVADYLKTASVQEVLQLRTVLDTIEGKSYFDPLNSKLEKENWSIDSYISPLLKESRNIFISSKSGLTTVKYIKDITGWGLKESKDWYDHNVRDYKPYMPYQEERQERF
jgi:hypothetical protein